MTSHFDNLVMLLDLIREKKFPQKLGELIIDEAVKELDSVDPEMITFQKYQAYRKTTRSLLNQKWYYISHCHNILDHNGGHHLRCFSRNFLVMFSYIKRIVREGYADIIKYCTPPVNYSKKQWAKIQANYPKIFGELKKVHEQIVQQDLAGW